MEYYALKVVIVYGVMAYSIRKAYVDSYRVKYDRWKKHLYFGPIMWDAAGKVRLLDGMVKIAECGFFGSQVSAML